MPVQVTSISRWNNYLLDIDNNKAMLLQAKLGRQLTTLTAMALNDPQNLRSFRVDFFLFFGHFFFSHAIFDLFILILKKTSCFISFFLFFLFQEISPKTVKFLFFKCPFFLFEGLSLSDVYTDAILSVQILVWRMFWYLGRDEKKNNSGIET